MSHRSSALQAASGTCLSALGKQRARCSWDRRVGLMFRLMQGHRMSCHRGRSRAWALKACVSPQAEEMLPWSGTCAAQE